MANFCLWYCTMETNSMCRLFRNFNRLKFHQLFLHFLTKGPIFLEKYWYYFHCPKNVLCSILSFVLWIFPPLAVELESADSIQNTISKSLFQDSFRHIFWAMRKMHHTLWKKSNLYQYYVISMWNSVRIMQRKHLTSSNDAWIK